MTAKIFDAPHTFDHIAEHDICPTLKERGGTGGGNVPLVMEGDMERVRRLTPLECERLQGMPDNWTKIPLKNKNADECPDSPRYRAIGNAWAVPVIHWIGKRIDEAIKELEK